MHTEAVAVASCQTIYYLNNKMTEHEKLEALPLLSCCFWTILSIKAFHSSSFHM